MLRITDWLCTQVHRVWSSTTSLKSSQFNGPQRAEYILENILKYEDYIIREAQRAMKHTWFHTQVWIVWKFIWVSQTHLDYILQILEYYTTVQSTTHFTQSHWTCRLRKCIYRATELGMKSIKYWRVHICLLVRMQILATTHIFFICFSDFWKPHQNSVTHIM